MMKSYPASIVEAEGSIAALVALSTRTENLDAAAQAAAALVIMMKLRRESIASVMAVEGSVEALQTLSQQKTPHIAVKNAKMAISIMRQYCQAEAEAGSDATLASMPRESSNTPRP